MKYTHDKALNDLTNIVYKLFSSEFPNFGIDHISEDEIKNPINFLIKLPPVFKCDLTCQSISCYVTIKFEDDKNVRL